MTSFTPSNIAAEMQMMRDELAELRKQQTAAQIINNLFEQLVQKFDDNQKKKI